MYKKVLDMDGTESTTTVLRKSDNAVIPFDNNNKDYQEYLEWVAEGNTPEPADE